MKIKKSIHVDTSEKEILEVINMKNSKLLIGTSLITMLTTGAVGTVATTQNASAYDVTANQATAQYSGTYRPTQSTQTTQSGVTATTGTQTNTQTTTTTQVSSSSKRCSNLSSGIKSSRYNTRLYNACYKRT